jgi:antitoxin PrlF
MANLLQTESTLTDRYQTTIPDAIRKALHLNKRDKILYTVQPDGHVFLSKIDEHQDDPIIDNFLEFIVEDIRQNPQHLTSINQTFLNRIESLVGGVEFHLNELLLDEEASFSEEKLLSKKITFGKTL